MPGEEVRQTYPGTRLVPFWNAVYVNQYLSGHQYITEADLLAGLFEIEGSCLIKILADDGRDVAAARLLCLQALWLKDHGAPHAAEAAMAKWWAPQLAYEVVHQCLLLHGHGGYDRGVMEQRLRDVLGFQLGDGTAQIMKTVIARNRAGRAAVPL